MTPTRTHVPAARHELGREASTALWPPVTGDDTVKLPALPKLPIAAGALLVWVAAAPWVWDYSSSASAVASHIFFVVAFGPLTLLVVALRPTAVVLLGAGVWLALSPWLLGFVTNHSAWLSDGATGILLAIVAARAAGIALPGLAKRHPRAELVEAAGSRP